MPARATREGWQVAALGGWLDVAHGNAHGWRWPCAADPWLAERLGAPEPIAAT